MDAGVADGTLREVPAWDVLMLLGGITLITRDESERELAVRLVDTALLGLRPRDA